MDYGLNYTTISMQLNKNLLGLYHVMRFWHNIILETDRLYQQGSEPPETMVYSNHLMRLSNWEDFIEFCNQESFKMSVIMRQWRMLPDSSSSLNCMNT